MGRGGCTFDTVTLINLQAVHESSYILAKMTARSPENIKCANGILQTGSLRIGCISRNCSTLSNCVRCHLRKVLGCILCTVALQPQLKYVRFNASCHWKWIMQGMQVAFYLVTGARGDRSSCQQTTAQPRCNEIHLTRKQFCHIQKFVICVNSLQCFNGKTILNLLCYNQ